MLAEFFILSNKSGRLMLLAHRLQGGKRASTHASENSIGESQSVRTLLPPRDRTTRSSAGALAFSLTPPRRLFTNTQVRSQRLV